jgi:hypothetical protein
MQKNISTVCKDTWKYPTTLRGGLAMGNLIFNSLDISKFRALEHLLIERLGRVDLIVGKKCNMKHKQATSAKKSASCTIF